ncbi:alpha/beta fold hydrolase [Dietzia sp. E1]|uniref:alpha/beta fold hydrolase n=1 Tax=Dietzia sp. E1 TaxID=328361 RepID=UPI0015FABED9|nr:alpha/beta fold hydrolase [Dietzia sp. E1]MBB1021134.1 alpha/beta fold hydrolase [Dietzia sp. E1]
MTDRAATTSTATATASSSASSVEPPLRELATDRGVLRYREAGDGPPLLLLHGSGPGVTGWRNFSGNVPVFAEHFRTIVLELPGFGGLERLSLIGNSMGGFIATAFALERPEQVEKLVTVGGAGVSIFSPGPGEGIIRLSAFVEDPTRERLIEWLHSMVYDKSLVSEEMIEQRWAQATDPETLASSRRMYGREALSAMAAAPRDAAVVPPWAKLGQVQAPTLITWGRDDRVSPVDMALLPLRMLPRGEIHVFPNCGHWVMIEQKAAFDSVVLGFLTRDVNNAT